MFHVNLKIPNASRLFRAMPWGYNHSQGNGKCETENVGMQFGNGLRLPVLVETWPHLWNEAETTHLTQMPLCTDRIAQPLLCGAAWMHQRKYIPLFLLDITTRSLKAHGAQPDVGCPHPS